MTREIQKDLGRVKDLARLMDAEFSVLGIKFGLDPIIDMLPVAGNTATMIVSLYIFYVAYKLELPRASLIRMVRNIFVDYIIGLVPVLGALGTVFFRSNKMNYRIIKKFVESKRAV